MDVTTVTGLKKPTIVEKIEKFGDLDQSIQQIIKDAIDGRKYAYCPYSNFKVGSAFRTKCGRIFKGCNVESASFTPTACAERTAISKAVSEGYLEFDVGAIVALQKDCLTTPCGVCRQFMVEFANEDIPLYITRDRTDETSTDIALDELVLCTSVYNLMPNSFRVYK